MIGGMICPPVEATASTAAANGGRKPLRFIRGMVIGPSTITLATALPDTVPNRLELTTATLPGPPAALPVMARAKSMNNWPVPLFSMNEPNRTNMMT
jgi:hypothetical protein